MNSVTFTDTWSCSRCGVAEPAVTTIDEKTLNMGLAAPLKGTAATGKELAAASYLGRERTVAMNLAKAVHKCTPPVSIEDPLVEMPGEVAAYEDLTPKEE